MGGHLLDRRPTLPLGTENDLNCCRDDHSHEKHCHEHSSHGGSWLIVGKVIRIILIGGILLRIVLIRRGLLLRYPFSLIVFPSCLEVGKDIIGLIDLFDVLMAENSDIGVIFLHHFQVVLLYLIC